MFQVIKELVDLPSFVGEAIDLDRRGFGNCPFHSDKTPSFQVKGNRWRCYGCGAFGDVFDFTEKFYNLSKHEAVKYLKGRAGIESYDNKTIQKKRNELSCKRALRKEFETWIDYVVIDLGETLLLLDTIISYYNGDWLFELITNKNILEYYWNSILNDKQNQLDFYQKYKGSYRGALDLVKWNF